MDDIGNLLYVLIFVIWFLYRAFGKSGKKTTIPKAPVDPRLSEPKPKTPSPPPVTFEDILRELTGTPPAKPQMQEEPPYEVYPEEVEAIPLEPDPESMDYLEEAETPVSRPMVSDGKFKEFRIRKKRRSKALRDVYKMLQSPSGARKAVMLKEILERRHF